MSYQKASHFETLESRRMLSTVTFDDGVLVVRGGNTDNVISVGLGAGGTDVEVFIGGTLRGSQPKADVTGIAVDGGPGNDTISINQANGRIGAIPVTLSGGLGHDIIRGGSDKIRINGGDGNDNLRGRGVLSGGAGNDHMEGSKSVDYMFGGDGHDFIDGEESTDAIFGDAGNDRLEGDEGNDYVFGGDGNDTITGGDGNDHLYGNAGIDSISGEAGDDTLFGGDDEDVLGGGDGVDEKNFGEYARVEQLMKSFKGRSKTFA